MNGQDYFELANNRLIVLSPKRCREPDSKTLPRKSHPKTNAAGVLLGATGCGSVLIQYFQIGPSPVLYKESDSSLIRVNESSWGALKPPLSAFARFRIVSRSSLTVIRPHRVWIIVWSPTGSTEMTVSRLNRISESSPV